MKALWNELIENENGMILSAELVIILTVAVLGIVVGLNHVALAINQELSDVGHAIGSLNQSYSFTGYHCCLHFGRFTSFVAGSGFQDWQDVCDCVCGAPLASCGEVGNGIYNTGSISNSGPVTASPQNAVTTNSAVETPCVNCPPLSAPAPAPVPDHGHEHGHGFGQENGLAPAPVPSNPPILPSPLNR